MAIECIFTLNGMPLSILECKDVGKFPAFSGQQYGRNNPTMTGRENIGPIPKGRYYILNRQSGGRMGFLYDMALRYGYGTDRNEWFALYRDDGQIDDFTFEDGIRRGRFRLHPVGPRGLSEGCITVNHIPDFHYLRASLLQTTTFSIPGTSMKAFGTVQVN
ncbi:hypothetical protein J2X14_002277 [Pantoea alhagi]|uniref:DUF2778 domain-containing protein n=1 Tax=Mixta sp. BE291 TaxID=3158787 RepID=UPI002855F298|nr:hypothetical protein [Pantoea alhagi]